MEGEALRFRPPSTKWQRHDVLACERQIGKLVSCAVADHSIICTTRPRRHSLASFDNRLLVHDCLHRVPGPRLHQLDGAVSAPCDSLQPYRLNMLYQGTNGRFTRARSLSPKMVQVLAQHALSPLTDAARSSPSASAMHDVVSLLMMSQSHASKK